MSAAGEVVVVPPDDASEGAGEHSDPGAGFAYSPVRRIVLLSSFVRPFVQSQLQRKLLLHFCISHSPFPSLLDKLDNCSVSPDHRCRRRSLSAEEVEEALSEEVATGQELLLLLRPQITMLRSPPLRRQRRRPRQQQQGQQLHRHRQRPLLLSLRRFRRHRLLKRKQQSLQTKKSDQKTPSPTKQRLPTQPLLPALGHRRRPSAPSRLRRLRRRRLRRRRRRPSHLCCSPRQQGPQPRGLPAQEGTSPPFQRPRAAAWPAEEEEEEETPRGGNTSGSRGFRRQEAVAVLLL